MPVNNHDDEMNPAVTDALNTSTEEALTGLIGVASSSYKNAQSGLRILKKKLDQHKEAKSQELKVQIGRRVVFKAKPGQKSEAVMSPEQGKKLNQILQDPSKSDGSLKISFGKEKILHISQGKVVADKLGLFHESQSQKQTEAPAQTEAKKEAQTQKQTEAQQEVEVQKETEAPKEVEPQNQTESSVQAESPQQTESSTETESPQQAHPIRVIDNHYTQEAPKEPVEAPVVQSESPQQAESPAETEAPQKPEATTQSEPQQQPEATTQSESQQQAESTAKEEPKQESPVEAEAPATTQEPSYESPVGKVLEQIDNAPGLADPPTDPIAKQNQINQYNQPAQQQAPAPNKDEIIEQLRSQLQQQSESVEKLSEQVNQLSEKMNNLSPIKLANEQLGSWVNAKRNALANAIRTGADRLAQGIEKHNESTAKLTQDVKDTVDKFKAGMERHDEAMSQALDKAADTRDKVTENVTKVVGKTQEVAQQAKLTQQQVVDSPQYKKGVEFFKSVAEPAVRGVVNQLDRIGGVTKDEQGNRTIESKNYNWTVTHDNKVQITNKKNGEQVTPANLDQNSLNTIKTFAAKAQEKGYVQAESQTQTQSQAPAQAQSQSQAPTPEAPKPVEAKPVVKV